jgi:group II intron reverse transcriptase/maturase
MSHTQKWQPICPKLRRVQERARANREEQFISLAHYLDERALYRAYQGLRANAAPGPDGETKASYGKGLKPRLKRLHESLKAGQYRATPAKRTYLDKPDGGQRAIQLQTLEDKIVQGAVVEILNSIYEGDFAAFSYGFRPGKSQHMALQALQTVLQKGKVSWVLDLDLKACFDRIEHEALMEVIQKRVNDKTLLRLIRKWLTVGYREGEGKRQKQKRGTPQGGVISPILANIYLHYALDLWFERVIKPRCQGQAHLIRFADDFVCTFQYRNEAEAFYRELPKRLNKFSLAVAPEKTCIHRFSRFHPGRKRRFTFLGFEFYWEADSKGDPRVWRRTAKKKLRGSLKACKEWLKANRHQRLPALLKTLIRKVRGHYNYFRVVGNSRGLWTFYKEVVKLLYKWLNRRSQRRSLTWPKLKRLLERFAFPRPTLQTRQAGNRGLA